MNIRLTVSWFIPIGSPIRPYDRFTSSTAESNVIGLLVGVAGAAAGNTIERMATREEANELLIQLKGGERRAVVQAKGSETLVPGDAVIIVTTGGKVRVTKAPK